jgi:hypothetical protein
MQVRGQVVIASQLGRVLFMNSLTPAECSKHRTAAFASMFSQYRASLRDQSKSSPSIAESIRGVC